MVSLNLLIVGSPALGEAPAQRALDGFTAMAGAVCAR